MANINEMANELEIIHKKLDRLQLENSVFASFARKFGLPPLTGQKDRTSKLSLDEMLAVVLIEEKNLKSYLAQGKSKADNELKALRINLQLVETSIKEVVRETNKFQRRILEPKQFNELEITTVKDYMKDTLNEKQKQLKGLEEKIVFTRDKITNIGLLVSRKKLTSNDMKFIDFHQLQIENKKFQKEVLEKSSKALKLKSSVR